MIVIPNLEFVVIISMDFLSIYHASIDCFKRQVVLFTLERDCHRFNGDRLEIFLSSLSCLGGNEFFYGMLSTLLTIDGEASIVE